MRKRNSWTWVWFLMTSLLLCTVALAAQGDFDDDGDVDRDDINILLAEIRSPGPHDQKFDVNGDGQVNRADARTIVGLCTRPRCAVGDTDRVPPVVTPPQDITLTAVTDTGTPASNAVIQAFLNSATAQDNVDGDLQPTNDAPAFFPLGTTPVTFSAKDKADNTGTAKANVTITAPLGASPRAIPDSGDAPLTVRFIPEFVTDNAVERFQWDFDGDGRFDRTDVIGLNQTFIYRVPGTYNVLLRVTDRNGKQTDGIVVVNVGNKPPEITAEANPSNGQIPLIVNFFASATDNEGVALYEWDFDGDGVFDSSSPTSGNASFTYTETGIFQASVRVTDRLGASATQSLPNTEVRPASPGTPSVTAAASPTSGDVELRVNFNATATDPDGQPFTNWEWDFEGDGVFDFSSSTSPRTSITYMAPGTFFARIRVTAADGDTAEDVIQIVARPKLSLSMSQDTIDPSIGESVSVRTVLGGDTRVSVIIENRSNALVKTLFPWGVRNAGTYDDNWSGLDDAGKQVKEGDYFAVLLSEVDGKVSRLDLRETTGGQRFNPPRTRLPTRFQPFADNPLSITFTLNRAAEVTAFMGRFRANTRLLTFFERKPLGRGSHTIVWNGVNGDGQLIHPPFRDSFLFGIFGFTLANNGVYVRSGAHVSSVSATPSILDPSGREPSTVTFDLTKDADVELVVVDAGTGGELTRIRYTGLSAGQNEIQWDGKTANGDFAAPGRYRLGLTAIDALGFRSITVYTVQRIYY